MNVKNSKKKVLAGIVVCSLSAAANSSENYQSAESLSEIKNVETSQEFNAETLIIEQIKPSTNAFMPPPTKKRHLIGPESWWRSLWNSVTTGSKDSDFS